MVVFTRAASWILAGLVLTASALTTAGAQTPPTPVPRPFPGAGGGASPRPVDPSPAPQAPAAPAPQGPADAEPAVTEAAAAVSSTPLAGNSTAPDLGSIPIYPTAEYLDSFDAGRGQQYHLYGTNLEYDSIVAYYRNVLDTGGREIYGAPAMRQFDLGRYDDERMAYPPSIVVKDYAWNGSPGYLHVTGTTETRYRTIIQVVPPDPQTGR